MTRTQDLTCGPIRPQLIELAVPLLLGNILQQFYNTIDSFIVGRYVGLDAFAALGVAGTVMNLFVFVLTGFCSGISIILANFYGRKDYAGFRNEVWLSTALGTAATVALSLVGFLLLGPVLTLIQTPAELTAPVREYLQVILLGLASTYLYNLCSAALRSAGNSAAALGALAIAMGANLVLDYLFVAVLGFGVAGAAWATVLAQLLSVGICVAYWKLRFPHLLFTADDLHYDHHLVTQSANYGLVSALHQSSLYIGKLLVQGAVNTMGTQVIAAYTATMRIEGFLNSFGDSGAAALSVFIAQNEGARDRRRAQEGFGIGLRMMVVLCLALAAVMALVARPCTQFLVGETDGLTVDSAVNYLRLIAPFYVCCFIGNSFVGFYRGRGLVHVPVIGTCLHISMRVVLSYLLADAMGLPAVALATGIGWIGVNTYQYLTYRSLGRKGDLDPITE